MAGGTSSGDMPSKRKSPAHVAWLKKKNAKKNAKRAEKQRAASECSGDTPPTESFREMEICPSPDELLGVEKLPVRKNIVQGAYQNAEDYLDLHFRLLREDFVRPLREALAEVRGRGDVNESSVYNGVKVYTGVRFEKLVREFRSLTILVKIDPDQINLANEKLFMYGSLLCFSQPEDRFGNVILAKVSDCYASLLRKGLIKVTLINPDEILDIVFGASYSMFESDVFFEPYFRVLTALQTMALDNYPMCNYVTGKARTIKTINQMRLEPNDNPGLNPTQFKGYCSALTNNLTLIQGPPGTGKTYLGLKVVKRMIEMNEELEAAGAEKPPPILVICATNHALDQFLEHIVMFCTDVIRVGGQSQSTALVDYMMTAKRKLYRKKNQPLTRMLVDLEFTMNKLRMDIEKKVRKLNKDKLSMDEQTELEDVILELTDELSEQMLEYQGCKLEKDLVVMRDARLIGMTTTSAARLRGLLDNLQPSIMIVEEAAEVLEGHIVGALTRHCRHIVLIGDHQQLRPITSCYRLSRDYQLDVSLFERLCKNGVPYVTLDTQHRMRPDFAALLVPTVYRTLRNDSSVLNRPNVRGVEKNLFFVSHFKPEESAGWSKKNLHEAEFLMALCRYLIRQGHAPEKITIIAMYAAQVTELENLRAMHLSLNGVLISSVDGYQGEENDIVLLSLVRSNKQAHIGFLWTVNRVCVALSRARFGLYIVGNMENLTRDKRSVWCRINKPMTQSRAVGTHLALRCSTHGRLASVSCAADFTLEDSESCGLGCSKKPRPSGSLESLLNDVTLNDEPQGTTVYTNGNLTKSASMQEILDAMERPAGKKLTPPIAVKGMATSQSNVKPAQNGVQKGADDRRGLPKPVSQVAPMKAKHFFSPDFEPEPLLKPHAAVTPFRVDDQASCSVPKHLANGNGPSRDGLKTTTSITMTNGDLRGNIQKEMEKFDMKTMMERNQLLARVLDQSQSLSATEDLNQNHLVTGNRGLVASVQPEARSVSSSQPFSKLRENHRLVMEERKRLAEAQHATRSVAPTRSVNPIDQHLKRVEDERRATMARLHGYNLQPSHDIAPSAPLMDDRSPTGAIPRTRHGEALERFREPQFPPRQPVAPTPLPRAHAPSAAAHQTYNRETTVHQVYTVPEPAATRPLGVTNVNHFADTRVQYGQDAMLIGEHRRQWPSAAPTVVAKPKKKSTCVMM